MMHQRKLIFASLAAVLAQGTGTVLNRIEVLFNRGMPAIGCVTAIGKYVPINQHTKIVALADVIRVGDYALSAGDLFFFSGLIIELIILWIAIPKGRKFFPLLIVSLCGIFCSIAEPNQLRATILCEIAAVLSVLAIYWKHRSNVKTNSTPGTSPVRSDDSQT
jgi:hypothetical protein